MLDSASGTAVGSGHVAPQAVAHDVLQLGAYV